MEADSFDMQADQWRRASFSWVSLFGGVSGQLPALHAVYLTGVKRTISVTFYLTMLCSSSSSSISTTSSSSILREDKSRSKHTPSQLYKPVS